MVYEDREDEFMGMNEAELYADDRYNDERADTFREQIPSDSVDDDLAADEALEEEIVTSGDPETIAMPASKIEDGFGESLNPIDNPHLEEQLDDQALSEEAQRDYPEDL